MPSRNASPSRPASTPIRRVLPGGWAPAASAAASRPISRVTDAIRRARLIAPTLPDRRLPLVPVGQTLEGARRRQDRVLLVGAAQELEARRQPAVAGAVRHDDGGQAGHGGGGPPGGGGRPA